jgi:hypothetical protein
MHNKIIFLANILKQSSYLISNDIDITAFDRLLNLMPNIFCDENYYMAELQAGKILPLGQNSSKVLDYLIKNQHIALAILLKDEQIIQKCRPNILDNLLISINSLKYFRGLHDEIILHNKLLRNIEKFLNKRFSFFANLSESFFDCFDCLGEKSIDIIFPRVKDKEKLFEQINRWRQKEEDKHALYGKCKFQITIGF